MPKLNISVPHKLDQETATQRLKDKFHKIKAQYGDQVSEMEETWDGNKLSFRFTTFGMTVQGDVASESSEVAVKAKIPIAAMMFRGKIEEQIRGQLEEMLG